MTILGDPCAILHATLPETFPRHSRDETDLKLAAFAAASLVLAVTPGPGVLYIVARTLAAGRRAGLAAVAGVAAGNLANAAAASLGLTALFTLWPPAFTILRVAGGAYLVWLGIGVLRAPATAWAQASTSASASGPESAPARQAFWVALLNPKTTLFFAALLPPFLDAEGSVVAQSLLLGAMFTAIAATTDAAYALAAGAVAPRLGNGSRHGRWIAGTACIGLGLYAAWP
jgi:threonine/homoserine/homoserine lactone efflux protein